jgi:hypothetical protein
MREEWKPELDQHTPAPVLNVWHNGTEWMIAYSEEDAKQALIEHHGWTPKDYDDDMLNGEDGMWTVWPADKYMKMNIDEQLSPDTREALKKDFGIGERGIPDQFNTFIGATCKKWCEAMGRGFLASTEW